MKENFRRTDKPKKRKRISYEPASQAAVREAIKKAHTRLVGDVPRKVTYGHRSSPANLFNEIFAAQLSPAEPSNAEQSGA